MKRANPIKPVLALVLCMLSGISLKCIDEPNPVGSSLLPPSDLIKVDSLTLVAGESYSARAVAQSFFSFGRSRMLIGKRGTVESWGLILFRSFPESLKTANVVGAEIKLRTTYHYGDSLSEFSLAVRKGLKEWTTGVNYDSLKMPGFYEPTLTPDQNFGSLGDTSDISITLDTSLVNNWLRSFGTTPETNFGLILEPTNSSVIKGFVSTVDAENLHRPSLMVRCIRSGQTQADTLQFISSFDTFVAGETDTSFVTNNATTFARAGVAFRSILGFDPSPLPPHAAIHRAILEVNLNSASSEVDPYAVDSLVAIYMNEKGYEDFRPLFLGRFDAVNPIILSEAATVNGNRVYRFNITEFVQLWVHGAPVRRVALAALTETNGADLFAVYGSGAANPLLRPRITVFYSSTQP